MRFDGQEYKQIGSHTQEELVALPEKENLSALLQPPWPEHGL